MHLPVCTSSPTCNSDIVTDLPFFRLRLDLEGKLIDGALVVVVVLLLGEPLQQWYLSPHLATHDVGHHIALYRK